MNKQQQYSLIYDYSRAVYEKTLSRETASAELFAKTDHYSKASYCIIFDVFKKMMEGKQYTRRASFAITEYFLTHILLDFGPGALSNALYATYQNIQYYYEHTSSLQTNLRTLCIKIAQQNRIDLDFSEVMFQKIIPKNSGLGAELDVQPTVPSLCWYVGAYIARQDQLNVFLENGIWKNGYLDRYKELVNNIQPGDKIAVKSAFVQKNNLPFDVNGSSVSVMEIKAIGTVLRNHGDGRTLDVDWHKLDQPKKWYFFTNRSTIWRVESDSDDWRYQALLHFTFADQPQDISRFLSYPYWAKKYSPDYIQTELEESTEYTRDDFLSDVFIQPERYDTIRNLLVRKKNIILQGAPGTGKTFSARRLAYSLMGEIDDSRICMIQFHQNYCYEDFIMGYKPDREGFTLRNGVFYEFCQLAKQNSDQAYFFLIDEINRGNMSKIFGELLMLLENDKRGPQNAVLLSYTGEEFYVPENLYLIGMMNTADRSLAILDYALRRRFCFFELEPAFSSPLFLEYLEEHQVPEPLIEKIIDGMTSLNEEIKKEPTLGKGFQIGHSYFCNCIDAGIEWYNDIILYEIAPLLDEYWIDDPDKAKQLTLELLR